MSSWNCFDFDKVCGPREEVVEKKAGNKVVKAAKEVNLRERAAEARNDRATDQAVAEIKAYEQQSIEQEWKEEERRKHRRWFGGRKKKVDTVETVDIMERQQPEQVAEDKYKIAELELEESKDLEDLVVKPRPNGSSLTSLLQEKRQLKAVYHHFGANPRELLQVEQEKQDIVPQPEASNHVVVKVQASTVSLQDCMNRRGFCFDLFSPVCLPCTPGSDCVGYIVARGKNVKTFKEGDRVAALIRTGGNGRYVSVPKDSIVIVPRSLDSVDAVCMVSIYATAYQGLRMLAHRNDDFSLKDKKVLVVGGMDAVGQALIELLKKAGAEVYATAPERRHSYIEQGLKATPLPESAEEWTSLLDEEMDFVFDGVCEDALESPRKVLKKDGRVICFGFSSMLKEEMGAFGAPMSAHWKRLTIPKGATLDLWNSFQRDKTVYKKNLQALFHLLKWQKIKPHVARRVDLSQIGQAHEKLETGEVRGTVVCLPWKRVGRRQIIQSAANE